MENNISLNYPITGTWRFLRPPGHHPFAFDFVKFDDLNRSTHKAISLRYIFGSIANQEFYCWSQPVYAPIAGKVFRIGDGRQDNATSNLWRSIWLWFNATYIFRPKTVDGRLDIRPNAGNYIMIESPQGYIVFLAHLRNGSIRVKENDIVSQGDMIGEVGNSGNSTMPHLHINVFDQMHDPYSANVLPFTFNEFDIREIDEEWTQRKNAIPPVGSFIRFS